MNKRRSGILMHISSLAGEYSIGSLGEAARHFADMISEAGFSIWQVLPMSMTDECGSPYKSPASFGANPYLIDLPTLYEEGLITREELRSAAQISAERVELERVFEKRLELLRTAAARVVDRTEIISYIDERPALSRASYFLALKSANGGKEWQSWDTFEVDIDELFFRQFVEYKFYTQWYSLKEYANSRGVLIIGDLPIYVAADSADVWAEPEQFLLDSKGYPESVAGVPPDYFSADGQLWGNPLYDWQKMQADGYSWWRNRLKHALDMYDGVRIDHFRAIESYWAVPASAESAKEGKWVGGPGKELIRAMQEVAGERLIIAEDLGSITDEVRALVDFSGFPGMRVLQFGFLDGPDSQHLPHNMPRHTIAYTGTHDNDTFVGFVNSLDEQGKAWIAEYVGAPDLGAESIARAAIRTLYASTADTVILPVQDILALGSESRMNTPGVADGNWRYRMATDDPGAFPIAYYKRLARLYGRSPD